ncbi:hypothetical protein [Paenibacillus protaetiae]|nr:hypothetical protein [Paenibacillus protaetiae]
MLGTELGGSNWSGSVPAEQVYVSVKPYGAAERTAGSFMNNLLPQGS